MSYMLSMNDNKPPACLFPLEQSCTRYLAEELPERHSTASRYRSWMKNHIEPKWRDFPIENIKPPLVEDWLKRLDLAPKSKSHLKNPYARLVQCGDALGVDSRISTIP